MRRGDKGPEVADLQRRLVGFGYLDRHDVDGDFGARTELAVRTFQTNRNLTIDGVVGPATLAELERPIIPRPVESIELERAQRAALLEAVRLWESDIIDPKRDDHSEHAERSRAEIDHMLRAGGRADLVPYLGDGHTQWCGYFLAKCYLEAGLDPHWLSTWFGSTWRLWAFATYHDFDEHHTNRRPVTGPYRLACRLKGKAPTFSPRAGDILIVGNGDPAEGDHITIVESYDAELGVFQTISGNGGGLGPDGKRREGVVRAAFHLTATSGYFAMWLYRMAPSDLILARG